MTQTEQDLVSFVDFAMHRIRANDSQSVEDLVHIWRREKEIAEAVIDIETSIAEHESGKSESLEEAFADIRRQLGIAL